MKLIKFLIILIFLCAGCSPQKSTPENQPVKTSPSDNPNMNAKPKLLNIAHRGARSLAPENTLLSAQKGFEAGADLWELDVAMSSDQAIVVIHDDTLERTSNAAQVYPDRRPWAVENFSLAELRRLDFGSWFVDKDPFKTIASGEVKAEDLKSFSGVTIPTLQEALQFTKDHNWRVNVEIKDLTGKPGDPLIVEKVVALVTEMGMESSVVISSFNHSYIQRAKKANPAIMTAALVEGRVSDPVSLLEQLNAQSFNPYIKTIDYSQIQGLRSKGKDIFVWTVNDEPTMRKLIEAGATGIFTDFPQLLAKVLASY
jgi:glycerophosphoryl diester phosphodiesterase